MPGIMTASRQRGPLALPSKAMRVTRRPAEPDVNDDLVRRCRAGDVDAFEDLYRQHSPRIYSLACRITGSPQEGEDLLQDIFLQVHRKLGSFRGDSALGTWLYRLAMNQCLDFVRSRQSRMKVVTAGFDEDGLNEPEAPRETPVERMDLERAVRRLPEGYRAAFVLHDIEGLDHKQIARMLGVTEGTSRSQVFKARTKLRAWLG
jgi:RNA polymerase sigma-70 factor, ECF subfamily